MRREWVWVSVWVWLGFAGEVVQAGIPLVATPTAEYGSRGVAELAGASLSLELDRLPPGLYQVQAALKSNGTLVTLAWVAVVDPDWEPEVQAGNSRNERSNAHQARILRTHVQMALPPGLQAADLGAIRIADSAGCVWLASN